MRFSTHELRDLAKAWLLLSIAFAIATAGVGAVFSSAFGVAIIFSGVTVGLGFLLHELSHKFFAQKYGCWAEFRSWDPMLWFAVLLSLTGIIFAAPGGVMIRGAVSGRRHGIIALAGPAMNIALGLAFVSLAAFAPPWAPIAAYGAHINAWLAVFNLFPFAMLDGAKVLAWNKWVYASTMAIAAVFMFSLSFVL